jgi:hypothetical protein
MKNQTVETSVDERPAGLEDVEPLEDAVAAPLVRLQPAALSIPELALRDPDPLKKMEVVGRMIDSARRISLRMVHATDVVLFRRDDGRITGYIQDDGVRRFLAVWGIDIFNLSEPRKIQNSNDPEDYSYSIIGDGFCRLTGGRIEQLEAVRASTEDFCKLKSGSAREKDVKRATRSSLDAAIGRQLAGLESIPIEELVESWKGTGKSIDACALGKGFGSRDARMGGVESPDVDLVPPACPVPNCGKTMSLRRGSKGPFYSCPDWKAHGREAKTIDLEKWKADPASKKRAETAESENPAPFGKVDPLDADEIFK